LSVSVTKSEAVQEGSASSFFGTLARQLGQPTVLLRIRRQGRWVSCENHLSGSLGQLDEEVVNLLEIQFMRHNSHDGGVGRV
jgi:hypothetical protein